MALAVTSLDSGGLGTNTNNSQPTNSVSPQANSELVLWVLYSLAGGTTVSGVSGLGLTWAQTSTKTISASTKIDCWTALTGASAPSPGVVTITFAALNASRAYDLDQVTSVSTTTPLIASNTLTATGVSGTSPALTMNAAASPSNLFLFACGMPASIVTVTPNETPPWTQLAKQSFSSPSITLQTQVSPNVSVTTPGATLSSSSAWGAIGLEAQAAPPAAAIAAGGGSPLAALIAAGVI